MQRVDSTRNGDESRSGVASPSQVELAGLRAYYQTSDEYRSHLNAKGPGYFERFVSIVCAHSSNYDFILDVGCGTGESTSCIARADRRVVGTDISPLFLGASSASRATSTARFVASDAAHLPFAAGSVDVVCSMEMIEHVWPVDKVLSEMDRVLKPGGRIVITSPNLISPVWLVRDLPGILMRKRFRPPLYNSFATALEYAATSLKLSMQKTLAGEPRFIPQIPDLEHADYGGDFDAVYKSNARDLILFFEQRGYKVRFVSPAETSFRRRCRNKLAQWFGSWWTSYMLVATKPRLANPVG